MNKNYNYKTTDNPWVPQIPEHWEILKAKHIGNFQGSTVDKKIVKGEKKIRVVNFTDVYGNENFTVTDEIDFMSVTARNTQIRDFKVFVGDMVFTPSSEIREDIGQSALIRYEANDLLFSYHLVRLKFTRKIDDNFKKYLFNNKPALQYFSKVCKGSTRKILNRIDFKNLPVYLPPHREQIAIANYLDEKCAEIQNFITKKQQLINLLKEQRQAIINDAVTKGINPDVKMKDSGFDWLGEIPQHWEMRRLGSFGTFSKGGNISRSELIYDPSDYYAILYGDIYTKYDIVAEEIINKISKSTSENSVKLIIGDLLFTGSGETKEDIGKCILFNSQQRTFAGGDVIIFKQNGNDSHFVSYSQSSAQSQYQKIISAKGDIIVHTYASKLKNNYMPYPDLEEQLEIVDYIKRETADIDDIISKTQKEIDLIKEYREALITEVVTGKINVTEKTKTTA